MKALTALLTGVVMVFLCAYESPCLAKRKEKTLNFDVPTTGTVTDVQYHPEFDEWWVKCQEGANIVVYTMDSKSQVWGKITFSPKKPDDKARPADKPKDPDKATPEARSAPPKPDTPEIKQETRDPEPKKEQKWWEPLNIFKSKK